MMFRGRRPRPIQATTGRFNGHVGEVFEGTILHHGRESRSRVLRDVEIYNQHIPQQALGHVPPTQTLKQWQAKRPDLFKRREYDLTGCRSYG